MCVLLPPAGPGLQARPVTCRRARRAARLGWESYNVTSAVTYWRDAGDAGCGTQDLEVRLTTLEDKGSVPKGALPLQDVHNTLGPRAVVKDRTLKDALTSKHLAPTTPAAVVDFVTDPARPALRPLLVVYSEEPHNATSAADAAAIDGQEVEDDDDGQAEAEVFTVDEKSNGGRRVSHSQFPGGRFRRTASQPVGAPLWERSDDLGDLDDLSDLPPVKVTVPRYPQRPSDVTPVSPESTLTFNINNNSSSTHTALDDRKLSHQRRRRKYSSAAAQTRRRKRALSSAGGRAARGSSGRQRPKRGKQRRRSRRQCRKVPMFVSFAEINWHKWVIAPKGYEVRIHLFDIEWNVRSP